MSIEKMEYLSLVGLTSDLDKTLEKCIESGCFHINEEVDEQGQMTRIERENPYKNLLKKIISMNLGSEFKLEQSTAKSEEYSNVSGVEKYIVSFEERLLSYAKEIADLTSAVAERKKIFDQLSHLRSMGDDVQKLFVCNHIKPRFGRLPVDSVNKLSYYEDKTFIFLPYDDDGSYKWGIYFAPKEHIKEIDDIFKSLFFEKIWIPDTITESPKTEIEKLRVQVENLEKILDEKKKHYYDYIKENEDDIKECFTHVKYWYDVFELRKYALIYKNKFYLSGYVPRKQVESFKELIETVTSVSILSEHAKNDDKNKVPIKLKTNRFARPFTMFVEMYGLPSYGGFNPTNLVALTYTIMFGIMFGDVGQGLLISLLGFLIHKKTGNLLGAIMERIGISSAVFGLLYGSVFGFEHLLDPLYNKIGLAHKPLEVMDNANTMTILLGAVAIGVVIILISILINIFVTLKKKDFKEALFGNNGIVGLVFFSAILGGIASTMLYGKNLFTLPYVLGLIVLPVILMFFREPLGTLITGKRYHMESGIGDFIATNFFEVFEFLLGYATNTLSFVRIGGFIFSHAGMMSVVMLLAEGTAVGISPIVIIIGNLFVIGMEGLIVGIQVLRLEFYEVFSRFYDGDGVAFEPVSVKYEPNID